MPNLSTMTREQVIELMNTYDMDREQHLIMACSRRLSEIKHNMANSIKDSAYTYATA